MAILLAFSINNISNMSKSIDTRNELIRLINNNNICYMIDKFIDFQSLLKIIKNDKNSSLYELMLSIIIIDNWYYKRKRYIE